jgi:PhnB protein
MSSKETFFAPQLFIHCGCRDISFYSEGLEAVELRRWNNPDGTIHVAEFAIDGCIFHLHEESPEKGQWEPIKVRGNTALIGLFVDDVDRVIHKATQAGATTILAAQDYDYGYRQGEIRDPFGHIWLIQKKIT